MSLRAIVFDFDGVIANSEPLHYQGFRDVLAQEGDRARRGRLLRAPARVRRCGRVSGSGEGAGRGMDAGADWRSGRAQGVELERLEGDVSVLFDGAADAIRRAAAAVPIAIASGALGAEIRRVLDREHLTPFFTPIVSAEDTPASKPAPDPYLRAVAQLAEAIGTSLVPAECVAIEDSRWGLQSARAAGLRTVGITSSYGAAELAGADLVLPGLTALNIEQLVKLCSG